MNAPERLLLPDIQLVADLRNLPIQRAGVRDVAPALNALPQVDSYVVEAENFESIDNHWAYAMIESARPARRA